MIIAQQEFLKSPLNIGHFSLNSRVFQSPLSGVTDAVFRYFVRRYAPESMLYTEMINATEIHHYSQQNGKAQGLGQVMEIRAEEQPISIQLFDCRPDFMAEAARKAVNQGSKTIDINMGCPVNKITKKGGGSSLLRQPDIAEEIVKAVVNSVEVPVTVKTRLGWDDGEINILDFAKRMENAGAAMLTLHSRTRAQGYSGKARWEWIQKVKSVLTIPVIANGDIFSVETAIACLEQTGADGVMCSRGTLGNPFLVGEIEYFLKTGQRKPPISPQQKLECAKEHLTLLWQYKGDRGIFQARKHLAWYCSDFVGASILREQVSRVNSVSEGHRLLDNAINDLDKTQPKTVE